MNNADFMKLSEAYLNGFDKFSRAVMKRFPGAGERITPEAMISLYRGFLTAVPDIEKAIAKAGGKKDE